jgi:hypothetical protein
VTKHADELKAFREEKKGKLKLRAKEQSLGSLSRILCQFGRSTADRPSVL